MTIEEKIKQHKLKEYNVTKLKLMKKDLERVIYYKTEKKR